MAANLLVGKEIGDYLLEERIGRGATADVYRARQKSVARDVAIKIINPTYHLDDQSDFRRRFEREAQIIASLEHLHILPVHDYGITADGITFIAMRLMRGGSLDQLLAKERLTLERVLSLFTQIASALHYAHERGVVHRDIKPSNILLDELGNVYVSDFGVAKLIDHTSLSLTKTGYIIGAPTYSSPEQLRDQTVDRRSDIFALGILLYTMLVGHSPYAKIAHGVTDIIEKQINTPVPPLRPLRSDISPEVEAVALTALQKHPDDRYPTTLAMLDALNHALQTPSLAPSPAAVSSTPPVVDSLIVPMPDGADRALIRLYAVGGAAVLIVIGMVFFLSQALSVRSISTPPAPTIQRNVYGMMVDTVPSEGEIRLAQERIGESEFVAFISCTTANAFQMALTQYFDDYFEQHQIAFRLYDPAGNRLLQASLIDEALQAGAQALIICPLDDQAIREPMLRANNEAIPVVFTAPIVEDYNAVMLEPDNRLIGLQVGREAGRYLESTLDRVGNVVVIGDMPLAWSATRLNGMLEGLREISPDVQILARYDASPDEQSGYRAMLRALEEHSAFDVVLSLTDAISIGAIRALEEAGVSPSEVALFSVNGDAEAQQYILDGHYLRATLQISAQELAQMSADALMRLLGDGTLPQSILLSQGTLLTREILEGRP